MNRQNFPMAQQVPILARGCFQTGACTVASVSGKAMYGQDGGKRRRQPLGRQWREDNSTELFYQTLSLVTKIN